MFKRFDVDAIADALEADPRFKSILQGIKRNGSLRCPYDGITFGFESPPSSRFLRLVMPAVCDDLFVIGRRIYRYVLKHGLFTVCWEPLQAFKQAPYTTIKINPARNNITPSQMLDLIAYIMGSYANAKVMSFDEKVDIENCTPKEISESLYVAHKRKLVDFQLKNETYYFGARKGKQVKCYDKSKQMGLNNKKVTRIEKTVKYSRDKRPGVIEFLLTPRTNMFEDVVLVDTKKLGGSSKIMRQIKQEGSFMAAYKKLSSADRKALRKKQAFTQPSIDLKKLATEDLIQWLDTSPDLQLRIFMDRFASYIRNYTFYFNHDSYFHMNTRR